MLYVWGCGNFGQHGKGTWSNVAPEEGIIDELGNETVKLIGCGSSHTLAVTEKQRLFGWGNNANGQLGNKSRKGENDKYNYPTLIEADVDEIVGIACGSRHSYIWTREGTCLRFGENYIKDSIQENKGSNEIKWVESSQKGVWLLKGCLVKDVACGTRHALFCMKDGSVFACGANNRGQLGTAEETETNIPTKVTKIQHIVTKIACGSFHSVCLTDGGEVYHWGYGPACGSNDNIFIPTKVDDLERIIKVAAGDSHSVALSSDGSIFAWGRNDKGQFGKSLGYLIDEEPINLTSLLKIPKCIDIVCRDDTTAAILQNGSLLLWGNNIWDVLSGGIAMNSFIRSPFIVSLNDTNILQLALGSWHVAAITKCSLKREQKKVENNVEILNTDEESSKEDFGILETGRQSDKSFKNDACEKHKPMPWAKKDEELCKEQNMSCNMNSKGVLVDLEPEIPENGNETKRKSHENLEINESLKQLCFMDRTKDRSTHIDFAIETVMAENTLTFAPLKSKAPHPMASFYIRRPESKIGHRNNSIKRRNYAGMQRLWMSSERSRYSYSAGWKDGRSWEANQRDSMEKDLNALGSQGAVPTWNTESLLEMTTKFHRKAPFSAYTGQTAKKSAYRKDQIDGHRITIDNNRRFNEITTSYNLQTFDLSKLRKNENWKRSPNMQGYTKN